jgi:SAM-dependent methyltransferase
MTKEEAQKAFDEYFAIFPWSNLPPNPEGFDMGCGSGRWAQFVAPKVSKLHCIDPSIAIKVAELNLKKFSNVSFYQKSIDDNPLEQSSQDFGYSLGVVHHVPNTAFAIRACANLLKPGAPLLLYIYYSLDGRPLWFRLIWQISDFFRRVICRLPNSLKSVVTDAIAILIYWPLARLSLIAEKIGLDSQNIPLYYYRNRSLYTLRTDSRDRFGTSLEKRFNKQEIIKMMEDAGLVKLVFSSKAPFWCVVGFKS